ncbi:MAG: B-box zinc finger protein [Candidatus Hodarchaeota archaeon]
MALSIIGWANGLTQSGLLVFACILGLFFIYKSKRTGAILLLYLGLGTIGIGLWQLAACTDFISILLTEENLPIFLANDNLFSPLFWFFTTSFELIFGIAFLFFVALKLLVPEKKFFFLALFLIFGVIISLFYIFDFHNNVRIISPVISGEDIINTSNIPLSPIFFLMICDSLLFLSFNVFGLLFRSFKSQGIIKKKFVQLSTANLLFLIFFVIYSTNITSIFKLIMRIGEILSILIIYFALREAPEIPEKKVVKVEDGLFRLSRRPDKITEEEVTISKEKKICLVCKGKVLRFSFICPECETFYCNNCAKAIINMENACWACNTPLDDSKPFKPYKNKYEEIIVDKSKEDSKLTK